MNEEYVVIYEWTGENYSAYAPDLPGCVAAGDTIEETRGLMQEAMLLYAAALTESGQHLPKPTTQASSLAIAA